MIEIAGLKEEAASLFGRIARRYKRLMKRENKRVEEDVEKMTRAEATLAKAMGDIPER